jgi:Baculovirus F protein
MKSAQLSCNRVIIKEPRSVFYCSRDNNGWVYSVPSPTRLNIRCMHVNDRTTKDEVELKTITGKGILAISSKCQAYAEGNTLLPHFNAITTVIQSDKRLYLTIIDNFMPEFMPIAKHLQPNGTHFEKIDKLLNFTVGLNPQESGVTIKHIQQLIDELDERDTKLYFENTLPNFANHSTTFFIILVLVAIGSCKLLKMYKKRSPATKEVTYSIELTVVNEPSVQPAPRTQF